MAASKKKGAKQKAPRKTPPARVYHNDRYTLDLAEFGYDREAEHLARTVLLCEPPFTTALTGSGGAGKTSVMRYAMTLLGGGATQMRVPHSGELISDEHRGGSAHVDAIKERGRELMKQHGVVGLASDSTANPLGERTHHRVLTVWFNPWRSREIGNPVVALLRDLHEQLAIWGRNATWTAPHARAHFEAGLHLIGELADSAASSGDEYPPATSHLDSGVMRVAGALDRQRVGPLGNVSSAERFRLLFEHAIESVLGVVDAKSKRKGKPVVEFASAEQHRLVVFVDDLDRCHGAVMERVLESLELYLCTRYSVFVVGADLRAVRAALTAHWGQCPSALVSDYLERSFQNQLRIADSARCALFVHNRLAEWRLIDAPAIATEEFAGAAATHPLAQLIADVLPANPRTVKSFLNGMRLAYETARTQVGDLRVDELPAFALIHRLRVSAPRVFELLGRDTEYYLRVLQDFFEHCTSRAPYRPDPAHAAACALMVDAFRSMVHLDRDWRAAPLAPALAPASVPGDVALLLADRHFSRRWRDTGISAAAVRRYAGGAGVK